MAVKSSSLGARIHVFYIIGSINTWLIAGQQIGKRHGSVVRRQLHGEKRRDERNEPIERRTEVISGARTYLRYPGP